MHFRPPLRDRLVSRLQQVCEKEGVKVDKQVRGDVRLEIEVVSGGELLQVKVNCICRVLCVPHPTPTTCRLLSLPKNIPTWVLAGLSRLFILYSP